MKAVPDEPHTWCALTPELRASWNRSARFLANPGTALAPVEMGDDDLRAYRNEHRLHAVLPVLNQLLVRPAADAGLILAVGDAGGRLLWVDGDRRALRQAEPSGFLPGALWSEEAIGTSAPGMALATGRGVQVRREEHFAYSAHQFSCSAAPIRDPLSGELLGVVDLTGGENAVATHALPLIRAAVSAAEAQLHSVPGPAGKIRLVGLGTLHPKLYHGGVPHSLSLRHAELLSLLAWDAHHLRAGLSAAALSELIFGQAGHEVTLRAEMTRLRRVLEQAGLAAGIGLRSRPYRISGDMEFDAAKALQALTRGERNAALELYSGALLPASEAPGVIQLRGEVSALLREAVVSDGSSDQLWQYLQLPEFYDDEEAVFTALRVLPHDSPARAALVARMQR